MNVSKPAFTRQALYLGGFVALFIILGLGYSSLTPIFENSDETLHYPYVKHIADGSGLPLAVPDQLWNQEGTQPPLYYAIVAVTTFWIDTDNLLDHLQRNPHWLFTDVRSVINDNQNLVLHGPMDTFPYRHTALAVHIGRWWSLLFGVITVICTFYTGRHFFPTNLPLVITATALTALTPQFLRVSATVSNDSLSAALTSLTVLVALKATRQTNQPASQPSNHPTSQLTLPLLIGVLSALALLTKLSSLMAAVLAASIIVWRFLLEGRFNRSNLQRTFRWLFIIGATTIALSGWWFYRNYTLYGEWLATETHLNLAGRGELSLSEIWSLRREIARAYWATFGWGQIRPPEWVFTLLNGFTQIGTVGVLVAVVAKFAMGRNQHPARIPPGLSNLPAPGSNAASHTPSRTFTDRLQQLDLYVILFLLFWLSMSLVLYARWVMEVGSVSHTRLIFPSITAISLLLALGWHMFLPRRIAPMFSGVIAAGLIALNVYSLGWLLYPAFTPNQQAMTKALPVNVTFLD
ncbi:MAG: glycosyltransferase family 39 protein, partial [Anaerolineae bacterium]|nr:glycosyltransferase family 39 protein [Anaerolineae bacterium]